MKRTERDVSKDKTRGVSRGPASAGSKGSSKRNGSKSNGTAKTNGSNGKKSARRNGTKGKRSSEAVEGRTRRALRHLSVAEVVEGFGVGELRDLLQFWSGPSEPVPASAADMREQALEWMADPLRVEERVEGLGPISPFSCS